MRDDKVMPGDMFHDDEQLHLVVARAEKTKQWQADEWIILTFDPKFIHVMETVSTFWFKNMDRSRATS